LPIVVAGCEVSRRAADPQGSLLLDMTSPWPTRADRWLNFWSKETESGKRVSTNQTAARHDGAKGEQYPRGLSEEHREQAPIPRDGSKAVRRWDEGVSERLSRIGARS
jgi:hypothetical protein